MTDQMREEFETIDVILQEMRTRRVNNGKHTSPTLIAWSDRIEAAILADRAGRGNSEAENRKSRYAPEKVEEIKRQVGHANRALEQVSSQLHPCEITALQNAIAALQGITVETERGALDVERLGDLICEARNKFCDSGEEERRLEGDGTHPDDYIAQHIAGNYYMQADAGGEDM